MFLKFHSLLFGISLFLASVVYSQSIQNIRARTEGEKVIIEYDLNGPGGDSWLEVKPYGSHNSFATPLSHVTGDVGKVTPGVNKQIEWLYGHELDDFNGDLSFQLEAEAVFHLKIVTPKQAIRRGKTISILWTGGRLQDSIHFEFISPSRDVLWKKTALNRPGSFDFHPDRNLILGRGFQLQLTSRDEKVVLPIRVKRKVARLWLISPVAIAGGAIVYFSKPESEGLPKAPDPPSSN